MESATRSPLETLADTLRSHLTRPLRLDAEAERFVASTYGDVDAPILRALFADTGASDAETLLELLLFPDSAFQARIEPLISQLGSIADPEQFLRLHLHQPPIDLVVALDDGGTLQIPLPEELLDRFVTRLRVSRNWSLDLDTALAGNLGGEAWMRARVMLRNSAAVLGDRFAGFCGRLLQSLSSNHRDFWPALRLVVQMADELEVTTDEFKLLTDHKRRAFQMVEQQRDFERRLQHSNIETLLSQGQRVPTLGRAEALMQMRVIDALCHALFGKTTYFQPAEFE